MIKGKTIYKTLARAGIAAVVTLPMACGDAKFFGLSSVEKSFDSATAGSDLTCRFLRRPHPGSGSLKFDIAASTPNARLKSLMGNGLSDARPVNLGTGEFGFLGILLPASKDGKVHAEIQDGNRTANCTTTIWPLELRATNFRMESGDDNGGKAKLELIWSGLHDGDDFVFDPGRSTISPDLRIECPAGTRTAPANSNEPSNQGTSSSLQENFDCIVRYRSLPEIKSVRYRDQVLKWILKSDSQPDQLMEKTINIDLIRNSSAAPVTDPVKDPESCNLIPEKTGLAFSHLCLPTQSAALSGSTSTPSCTMVPQSGCIGR